MHDWSSCAFGKEFKNSKVINFKLFAFEAMIDWRNEIREEKN